MAAGGGSPRCGVDIDGGVDLLADRGGSDLSAAGIGGNEGPVEATAGENREVDGGVGGV
jgi:hypothetical protein